MTYEMIATNTRFRKLVQDNVLTRSFVGPLLPRLLYRAEFESRAWGPHEGLTKIDTRRGLMEPSAEPVEDGDPEVDEPEYEQWIAQLFPYGRAVDVDVPSSVNAAVSIFGEKLAGLGEQCGLSLNMISRNALFRAGLCGNSYVTDAVTSSTTIHVRSINGFTTARNTTAVAGSPVQFSPVSSSNPLEVVIWDGSAEVTAYVTGYVSDNPSKDVFLTSPGTLTLSAAVTIPASAYIKSRDASKIVRPGGAKSTQGLGVASRLRLAQVREANVHFSTNSVPASADGYYHAHISSTSQNQYYEDPEMQRLNTSLPDYLIYKEFALGTLLGCIFYRNEESPNPGKVVGGSTDTWNKKDPFPGSLKNTDGVPVERVLFMGAGGFLEYWQDPGLHVSEVGAAGRVQRFSASFTADNGITISLPQDRVVVIIRPPQDRFQQKVSAAWKGVLGPTARTDASTNRGSNCRYKRQFVVEHAG